VQCAVRVQRADGVTFVALAKGFEPERSIRIAAGKGRPTVHVAASKIEGQRHSAIRPNPIDPIRTVLNDCRVVKRAEQMNVSIIRPGRERRRRVRSRADPVVGLWALPPRPATRPCCGNVFARDSVKVVKELQDKRFIRKRDDRAETTPAKAFTADSIFRERIEKSRRHGREWRAWLIRDRYTAKNARAAGVYRRRAQHE
jgi:hypothetical protein